MKKIIFTLCISVLFINSAFALNFKINIDDIKIDNKSNELINELSKDYKVTINDFSNNMNQNKKVKEISKKLIDLSLNSDSKDKKLNNLLKYIYIDDNNGVNTLSSRVFIENYVNEISKLEIKYDYIQVIRTVDFENGVLSFVYLKDCVIDSVKQDMVISFWFKEVNSDYKLHYAWFNIDKELDDYFADLAKKENNGEIIGGAHKKISLTGKDSAISDEELNNLFNNNINSTVQINGVKLNGSNMYGSGFIIREGVVVTTWSLFLKFLTDSNYIFINDSNGNTYDIEGIVAANTTYDVVVLKLDKEVGKKVTFGSIKDSNIDDKLFTINSKENSGYSINYGSYVSNLNGKIKNLFALSESEVGSALYNSKGEVVGFNTADVINSDLSIANDSSYLVSLQELLVKTEFNSIKIKSLEDFKETYYKNIKDEEKDINIDNKIKDNYKKIIGDYESIIKLELIKGSYVDNILSLRYKNNVAESLDTLYMTIELQEELVNNGFKNTYNIYNKKVYENDKYEVIIKEDMEYLIIIVLEN